MLPLPLLLCGTFQPPGHTVVTVGQWDATHRHWPRDQGLVRNGMLSSPGRRVKGRMGFSCALRGSWLTCGGGGGARRTEKGHWGLVSLSPTPGSALEGTRADADSGSWFLPGPPQSSFFSVSRYILGLARGHTNRKHIARLCRPYAAHPEPGAPACCLQSLGCVPWEPKHSSLLPLQLITPPSILHPRPQPGPRAHVTAS